MGIRALETAILDELRQVEDNMNLRKKDIMEWSSGEIKPHKGEKIVRLPKLRINCAIKA